MANTIKIKERDAFLEPAETHPKDILTLEILQDLVLEGIQRSHDEYNEDIRNFEETRKLVNFLLDYAIKQAKHDDGYAEEKDAIIAGELNADSLLLGYTHFICDSDTNPYNWSYLLASRNKFASFLSRFTSYITWVTKDMSVLLSSLNVDKEVTFVIDEFLGVMIRFEYGINSVEANVCFDNLSRIYSVSSNGYKLKVLFKDKVIGVFWRAKNSKLEEIIDFIKEEICHYENI